MRALLALALAAAVGAGLWWRPRPAAAPDDPGWMDAPTTAIERRDMARFVEAVGVVQPAFVLEVKSKASGEIVSMPYQEGDRVEAGALLVELLPVDEERNLRKQRAAVLAAEAQLVKARNEVKIARLQLEVSREQAASRLERAKVDHEVATADLARRQNLFARDLVSQRELDDARRAAEQAEAELEVAQSQVRALKLTELQIEARRQDAALQQAALQREEVNLEVAELRLAETRIHAPMEGLVLSRPVERGQIIASGISNVNGGTTLMSLADVTALFLEAQVDESDIGGIQVGLEAELAAEAYPDETFAGVVERVAPQGVDDQNVTVFPVRVRLGSRAVQRLKPGMNATARIVVERRPGALVVPAKAIRRQGDAVGLRVRGDRGRPRFVPVEVGIRDGASVEVRGQGLSPGLEVLVGDPPRRGDDGARERGRAMRNSYRAARRMGAR